MGLRLLLLSAVRPRSGAVMGLLTLLAVAAAADGWNLSRQQRINQAISAQQLPAEEPGQPRELQFARAAAAAASGADDEALERYRALQDDTALGQAARFNSANALLRQAVVVRAGVQATAQPGQAIPLIELAKEGLREVLRADPAHWGARYNLERAQRLLPDPEDGDEAPQAEPNNAERAATTMRGFSPGLP